MASLDEAAGQERATLNGRVEAHRELTEKTKQLVETHGGQTTGPPDQALRGVVFDLDDTLTDHSSVEAEVWARTVEHICAALPEVDADELRHRHLALRDTHYAEVLAGRTDLDGFRRAHLRAAGGGAVG